MTGIANRPSARWLPSRSDLAIFRLIGFLLSRRACDEAPQPGMLAINPAQNTIEKFSVSAFAMFTVAWYLTLALERLLVAPAAIVIAVLFTPMAVQIPLYLTGGALLPLWRRMTGRGDANNLRFNSIVLMTILFALAALFAFRGGWTRYLALTWLAAGCVNAIAAVAMFFLKDRVRELESRCGA